MNIIMLEHVITHISNKTIEIDVFKKFTYVVLKKKRLVCK